MNLQQLKTLLNNNHLDVFDKLGMKYESYGDNIYSICPAHDSGDNPRAFSYSVSKKIWKCWTKECQLYYNNDIFGIIKGALSQQTGKELSFSQVLQWITSNYKCNNIEIQKQKEVNCELSNIIKLISKKRYEDNYNPIILEQYTTPSEYFMSRGFLASTLLHFNVGDCYNKGPLYERSIIPIYNDTGEYIIGATARAIKEYRNPKYIIHPKGLDKNSYLYNYHRAIHKAKETSCMFITEGQGDVWRMHEAGVANAVGLFGKTLSDKQEYKLNKLGITHLVILLDNDQAGREAKVKIQRQLGRMYTLLFPRITKNDIGDMTIIEIKNSILSNLKGTF